MQPIMTGDGDWIHLLDPYDLGMVCGVGFTTLQVINRSDRNSSTAPVSHGVFSVLQREECPPKVMSYD